MLYQIFSRNNDVSGNPYRLGLVYDNQGEIIKACEARSSMPNFRHSFDISGYKQIMSVHLAPSKYNGIKRTVKNILIHSN